MSENIVPEPPDHQNYFLVHMSIESIEFFINAMSFYETLLDADINTIKDDKDIGFFLTDDKMKSSPLFQEKDKVLRIKEWLSLAKEKSHWSVDLPNISHGLIRYLKAVGVLYLNHIKLIRNRISQKPNITKFVMEEIDGRISKYEEFVNGGLFKTATAPPLLVDQITYEAVIIDKEIKINQEKEIRPRPILLTTIEILDTQLKERCLDLFQQFKEDGNYERLDTVVNEASRIVEDRLRLVSGADATLVGMELTKFAFGGENPKLAVSTISSEQESVHLLFRGYFGFIRNQVHHRLINEMASERVLQIIALSDYLIHLIENAKQVG
jgi:uncharacterized protein (TIGR02391 family)